MIVISGKSTRLLRLAVIHCLHLRTEKQEKVLAFDAKEANAIISGGAVNTRGWKGHSSSASAIYSVSGGNTYYLVEESGVVKSKETDRSYPSHKVVCLR